MTNKKMFRFYIGYDKDKYHFKSKRGRIVSDNEDSAIVELEQRYPADGEEYGKRMIFVKLITKAKGNINELKDEIQELHEKMKEKIKLLEDWTGEKYEIPNE